MKPESLSVIKIPSVNIGLALISKLEIDLTHVNYGLDKSKNYRKIARSNFSEVEIADIFNSLDGFFLNPTGKKDNYLYFSFEINYQKNNYMLTFCISINSTDTAGIITLYKIKN